MFKTQNRGYGAQWILECYYDYEELKFLYNIPSEVYKLIRIGVVCCYFKFDKVY